MRPLAAAVALALLAGAPAPGAAEAAGWSPPQRVGTVADFEQPVAAVDARGDAVVAWTDGRAVRVASARGGGRFGRPVAVGRGGTPSVALAADGSATIVFSARGTLRFARRTGAAGRFGAPRRLAAPGSREGDGEPFAVARPGSSVLVLYESPFRSPAGEYVTRLRAVDITAGGVTRAVTELGRARLGAVGVSPAGDVVVCCRATPVTDESIAAPPASAASLLVRRATARAFSAVALPDRRGESLESLAVDERGRVLLGSVDVRNAGDAGTFGTPIERLTVAGTARPAPVVRANRAFGPVVGFGAPILLWQEKTRSTPFSRLAPLHARVGTTVERLDAAEVDGPLLAGDTAGWVREGQWHMARIVDGRFVALSAPAGGPAPYQGAPSLVAAGRWRVAAWGARQRAVASVRRL